MKKYTVIFCLFAFLNSIQSQHHPADCGTPPPSAEQYKYIRDIVAKTPLTKNSGIISIPIELFIVRHSDGSGGFSLDDINKNIANLNYHFLGAGLEFFLTKNSPTYIDNDDYLFLNDHEKKQINLEFSENIAGAVSLIYTSNRECNGYCNNPNAPYPGSPDSGGQIITMLYRDSYSFFPEQKWGFIAPGTLPHEMGHYFNLIHTFAGNEHVIRTGPNANCLTDGDLLCDTPADHTYSSSQNCIDPIGYDIFGDQYMPLTDNIMDYSDDICGQSFTPNQLTRIQQGYLDRINNWGFTFDNPPAIVSAPNSVKAKLVYNGIQIEWEDSSNNETGFLIERSDISSTNGFQAILNGGTAPNINSFIDKTAESNKDYWYRVKVSNGGHNAYSHPFSISSNHTIYCEPKTNRSGSSCNNENAFINGLVIQDALESTTIFENAYSGCHGVLADFTHLSIPLNTNTTYTYKNYFPQQHNVRFDFAMWIDFNQDGNFDYSEQLVDLDNVYSTPSQFYNKGQFTIPLGTVEGVTRMRVIGGRTAETLTPCDFANSIEAEDYTVIIGNPLQINLNDIIHPTCSYPLQGMIDLAIAGGIAPYTYSWDTGQQTEDLNNLNTGSYTITVTDATGLTATKTVKVNLVSDVYLDIIVVEDFSCANENNGQISVVAHQGIPPYQYSIDNQALTTTSLFTGLTKGYHTISVQDANACSAYITEIFIAEPEELSAKIDLTNPSCTENDDNEIKISAEGGTPPYEYSLNNGTYISNPHFTNLSSGPHSISVRDNNGCTFIESAINFEGSVPNIFISSVVDADCGSNGQVNTGVYTGGGATSYSIDGGNHFQNSGIFSNLDSGDYTVIGKNNGGCQSTPIAFTINGPSPFQIEHMIKSNLDCNQDNDGWIDLEVSGGTPPYNYSWSHGATSQDLTNLGTSNIPYSVTITDANNCDLNSHSEYLVAPSPLGLSLLKTDPKCAGADNGTISPYVSGGVPPYTFLWDDGISTKNRTSLLAGNYTLTVTDAHNCTHSTSISLNNKDFLVHAEVENNCSSNNINLIVIGGTFPYTYLWNDGATTEDRADLSQGNYSVTITSSDGCEFMRENIAINTNTSTIPVNATAGIYDVQCHGENTGYISFLGLGGSVTGGTPPYQYDWSDTPINVSPFRGTLLAGVYTITVTDSNGCFDIEHAIVSEPPPIEITIEEICENIGAVQVTISGGTLPYTDILWEDTNGNTRNIENPTDLTIGDWTLEVTDANNCVAVQAITIGSSCCPDYLILTQPDFDLEVYSVTDYIQSSSIIEIAADITYIAPVYIELLPGFEVKEGAEFHAYIDNSCQSSNLIQEQSNAHFNQEFEQAFNEDIQLKIGSNTINKNANIQFHLPTLTKASIILLSTNGQLITTESIENTSIGWDSVTLDTSNCPSGIYFIQLNTEQQIITKKIMIMR